MDRSRKQRILFLCTGNSCRSQMAEGWARHLAGGTVDVYSAGVEKRGVDPRAVTVMAEAGVDIGSQNSKLIEELPAMDFDYIITLCDHARESCPFFSGKGKKMHRAFDDPPFLAAGAKAEDAALAPYRRVRDEIRVFVTGLVEGIVAQRG